MKKVIVLAMAMVMAAAVAWAGCGSCPGDKPAESKATAKIAACKAGDTVYACAACKTCDVKAGKCPKCGADFKAMNVLAAKDAAITLCPCEVGCKCTVKADDATQCSCGKAVVALKCGKACKKGKKACDAPKAKDQ